MITDFGKWLGEENGKQMVREIFSTDCTKEQARAAVTTYCLIFDIEVDTAKWDALIQELYEHYDCWFDSLEDIDEYMSELLV